MKRLNFSTSPARLLGLACLLAPVLALAHTGADAGGHHGMSLMDGLLHPLSGLDHLAAMLAVGMWSSLAARRLWAAPLAFMAMLLVGALLALAGLQLPAVEPAIASSLLVLGLLVSTRAQLPVTLAAALVGAFALFHGLAHGAELPAGAAAWPVLAGMVLATGGLHLLGLGLGQALRSRSRWWSGLVGAVVAALGGALLLPMI